MKSLFFTLLKHFSQIHLPHVIRLGYLRRVNPGSTSGNQPLSGSYILSSYSWEHFYAAKTDWPTTIPIINRTCFMPATLRLTGTGVNAVGGGWMPSKDLIARIANPNVKRAAVSTQEMNINDTLKHP
jgi:hypothetical protein